MAQEVGGHPREVVGVLETLGEGVVVHEEEQGLAPVEDEVVVEGSRYSTVKDWPNKKNRNFHLC